MYIKQLTTFSKFQIVAVLVLSILLWGSNHLSLRAETLCLNPYIVQKGDTLIKIAQKCGVKYSALLAANPQITNPNLIEIGDKITIPGGLDISEDIRQALLNARYNFGDDIVTLTNGRGPWNMKDSPRTVLLIEPLTPTDIDHDGRVDVVVILKEEGNFTGRFYSIHLMLATSAGYHDVGMAYIGDRTPIQSITIQPDGAIVVATTKLGPNDPMMGPSVPVAYTYYYRENELMLIWEQEGSTSQQTGLCPDGLSSRLATGARAIVRPGDPNTLWSDWHIGASRVERMEAGSTMVIEGDQHECRNGFTWWHVRSETTGKQGWTAESRGGDGYYLDPIWE